MIGYLGWSGLSNSKVKGSIAINITVIKSRNLMADAILQQV